MVCQALDKARSRLSSWVPHVAVLPHPARRVIIATRKTLGSSVAQATEPRVMARGQGPWRVMGSSARMLPSRAMVNALLPTNVGRGPAAVDRQGGRTQPDPAPLSA